MTQDQVYVPWTRSEMGLPPLNPEKEDIMGRNVSEEIKSEFFEAIGDSPIGAFLTVAKYLVGYSLLRSIPPSHIPPIARGIPSVSYHECQGPAKISQDY